MVSVHFMPILALSRHTITNFSVNHFYLFILMIWIKPRASRILGNWSTMELHAQLFLISYFISQHSVMTSFSVSVLITHVWTMMAFWIRPSTWPSITFLGQLWVPTLDRRAGAGLRGDSVHSHVERGIGSPLPWDPLAGVVEGMHPGEGDPGTGWEEGALELDFASVAVMAWNP